MEGFIRRAGSMRSLRPHTLLIALTPIVLSMAVCGFVVAGKAYTQDSDDSGGDFVGGEIVAKLNLAKLEPSGTCEGAITEINAEYGTATKEIFLQNKSVACIYLLQTSPGASTEEVANNINGDGRITYAEPNFTIETPESERHKHGGYPGSDHSQPSTGGAKYGSQYAMGALKLRKAHSVNTGRGSTVAVLDTGVQADHPEFDGKVLAGESFVSESDEPTDTGNNLDDDGDNEVDEMVGHGTHVAGIVHLAAPNAEIMPLRVLDSDGNGNVYLIAEALQYAVDRDVDVINMSFGTSRPSRLIQDVSDDLEAEDDDDDVGEDDGDDDDETGPALTGVPLKGAVAVGSIGNDSASQRRFPAAEANVIGIASVNGDKRKSGFSNYSRSRNHGRGWVDIAAPGTDIYSLFPDNRYVEWSGTSMAAPFVAGQAALIRSQKPGLDSTAPKGKPSVTKIIKYNASSLNAGSYRGKLGAGHADAYNSLR